MIDRTADENIHVYCPVNETEQIESKLGELRLSQLPELSPRPMVPAQAAEPKRFSAEKENRTGIKYRRLNIADNLENPGVPCPSYAESVDDKSSFYQFQMNELRRGNEPLVVTNEPSTSNESNYKTTGKNSHSDEMYKPNNSHVCLPYNVSEALQSGTSSRQDTENAYRHDMSVHDDNQNCLTLPSANNVVTMGIENNNLFSVSPDMNALLSSNYNGLPLIPIFATRQINSSENIEVNVVLPPRQGPLVNDSTDLDDEGFDEPTDTDNSAIHMTLNSDLEEDFAL